MTTYSPKTLEMVAEKMFEIYFSDFDSDCHDAPIWEDEMEEDRESFLRLARHHLDEIGGVLGQKEELETHRFMTMHGIETCPHCK